MNRLLLVRDSQDLFQETRLIGEKGMLELLEARESSVSGFAVMMIPTFLRGKARRNAVYCFDCECVTLKSRTKK